jgi:drug/metabolite transporter (DMT)-like permease
MALRGAFTAVIVLAIIAWRGEFGRLHHVIDTTVMTRSGAEATVGLLLIYALALMPIADVTAILLVQPFMLTIAGVIIFKETVGWRRWLAVAGGFVGMLLVVKPGTSAFDAVSLVVVLAAVLVVVRDIATRKMRADVPTNGIVLLTATLGILIGGAGSLRGNWVMPDLEAWIAVVVAAAFFVFAIMLGVIAFRDTDVSVVAPFRYALVVFAVIYGIILFREFPDAWSFAGIAMIVGAGLYVLHREAVRQRQMRASPSPAVAVEDRAP